MKDKTGGGGCGCHALLQARAQSVPQTPFEMAGKAMLAALDDAGLTVDDVDGLALYSMGLGGDTSLFAQVMGIPEVRFTGTLTGGGGGAAGSVGLAGGAIHSGMATTVVSLMTLQQAVSRFGVVRARGASRRAVLGAAVAREGLHLAVGAHGAWADVRGARRCGTCTSTATARALRRGRDLVARAPDPATTSIMKVPAHARRLLQRGMIAEPLYLYDFCLRVRRRRGRGHHVRSSAPRTCGTRRVKVTASAHGGMRPVGSGDHLDDTCPTSTSCRRGTVQWRGACVDMAGMTAADVDVALIYDHFSPMVLLQRRGLRLLRRSARAARSWPTATSAGGTAPSRSTPTAATSPRRTSSG